MKITSDLSKKYLSYYNEAKSVALDKKKILKNNNYESVTYFTRVIINIILFIILSILLRYFKYYNLSFVALIFVVIYSIYVTCITVSIYFYRKKKNFITNVTFDEVGITGEFFNDIIMTFKWDKLKALVIRKKTVVILTNSNIYFYFNINEKDKIVSAIKKYNSEMLIIK